MTDLKEAIQEVLDVARRPKTYPPGMQVRKAVVDDLPSLKLQPHQWHESLTPTQETVARYIWENCTRFQEPWEHFEAAFLCDYHVEHELRTWLRITTTFVVFSKLHPSVSKPEVINNLCALSFGMSLKGQYADQLTELWNEGHKR